MPARCGPSRALLLEKAFAPGDEAIVEWRALTVALLDQIAEHVRLHLGHGRGAACRW